MGEVKEETHFEIILLGALILTNDCILHILFGAQSAL